MMIEMVKFPMMLGSEVEVAEVAEVAGFGGNFM